MDLQTFVTTTLAQIVEGVREAQAGDGGGVINSEFKAAEVSGHLMHGGSAGMFTRVDFDVAVSVDSEGGAKGNLMVYGFGVEGGGKYTSGHVSRISFSVPVKLPEGDKAPKTAFDRPIEYPPSGIV